MKILISILLSFAGAQAFAENVLYNCMAPERAEFFISKLEDISQENMTPVLLTNDNSEVVGVISVQVNRDKKNVEKVTSVEVQSIELCSKVLETDSFYYADGNSADLLKWVGAKKDSITITQDEGMLVVNAELAKKDDYASRIKVNFKGYDVFSNEEEPSAKDKKNPDFIADWGLPKGKGEFYFYMPANWLGRK